MSDLRMPDLNKVFLAGRLTHDPELRYTPSNQAVCKLRMAINRVFRTKEGERRDETFYINATAWARTAEYCGEHLKKGRPVLVEGRLRGDSWEDKATGQKRTSIEVTAERVQQLDWGEAGAAPEAKAEPRPIEEPIPEDDIPF